MMKKSIKRIMALTLSVLIVLLSLNLTVFVSAGSTVKDYLGSQFTQKDSFEYPSGTDLSSVWETSLYNGQNNDKGASVTNIKTNPTVVADPQDSNNKVLKMGTAVGKNQVGTVLYKMKNSLVPFGRRIKSLSFKVYKTNASDAFQIILYSGRNKTDETMELCNSIELVNSYHVWLRNGYDTVVNLDTNTELPDLTIAAKTWTNVTLEYIYNNGSITGYTLRVGDKQFSKNVSAGGYAPYNSNSMSDTGFSTGFLYGLTETYLDDITIRYELSNGDTASDVAADFRNNFAAELDLTTATVTSADKVDLDEAFVEYNALPSEAQLLLTNEKSTIDSLLNKIEEDKISTEASDYKATHATILAKNEDTIQASDMDALNAAYLGFLDLTVATQNSSLLATEKANLKAMLQKLKGSVISNQITTQTVGEFFDDFEYENGIIPSDIYETKVNSTATNPIQNITSLKGHLVESPTDPSNHVLKLDKGIAGNWHYYALNSSLYPTDRKIKSLSFKYYSNSTRENAGINLVVYQGLLRDSNTALISYALSGGKVPAIYANGVKYTSLNELPTVAASGWTDVTVEYVYEGTSLAGFTVTIDNGTTSGSHTYSYLALRNELGKMKATGFTAGISFPWDANAALIDDLHYVFAQTADESGAANAADFKKTYASVLAKAPAAVTDADKTAVKEAIIAYGNLSGAAQECLTAEAAALTEMAEKLFASEYAALQAFIQKYKASIFDKDVDDFVIADLTVLKEAYDAHAALDDISRSLAGYPYKYKIDNALKYMSDNPTPRVNGDYSSSFFDFEYLQNPLVLDSADEGQFISGVVKDPYPTQGNEDNNVFKLEFTKQDRNTQVFFTLKDEYWPKGATQVTSYSFKFCMEDITTYTRPMFCYSYIDEDNYYAIYPRYLGTGSPLGMYSTGVTDGQETYSYTNAVNVIPAKEWATITFTFTDNACAIAMDTSIASYRVELEYKAGSRIAFGFKPQYDQSCQPMYIDDISINYEKGTYDVDETIEDIVTYYAGNTLQKPDDTVQIIGEGLINTVASAELYTVPNQTIDPANPQYVFETSLTSSSTDTGVTTLPTTPTWNATDAIAAEFVQRAEDSVKFTLPASLDLGIYAVKLKAAVAGKEDKILYLNNPHIKYYMGDDGDDASQGGSIRLIGENLYVDDAHPVTVVAKSLATGAHTTLTVTKTFEDDNYTVEAAIPENFAAGKYEVMLHNGYGDNTCWSEPLVFSVTEKQEKEIWAAKGWFDVTQYGADGTEGDYGNDTPAFIKAIEAAYQNGGGTVYVPRGQYHLVSTLIIPQNVSLIGESQENTMLFWTARRWQYMDARTLISISGNCEIKNFYLYATRYRNVVELNKYTAMDHYPFSLKTNPEARDNVYLENLRIRTAPFAGFVTSGGTWTQPIWTTNTSDAVVSEVEAMVIKESQKNKLEFTNANGKNYQFSNIDYYVDGSTTSVRTIYVDGDYVNINHFSDEFFGFGGVARQMIIEDCYLQRGCTNITGGNMYYARNLQEDRFINNRELYVMDLIPQYTHDAIQFIGEREDIMGAGNTDQVTYKLLGYTNAFKQNALKNMEIWIYDGQGYGQARRIVSSETDGTFKVDEPFTIAPNRNSRVIIFTARTTNFFVKNKLIDGCFFGPYGTSVNTVWDGNSFSYTSGQGFTASASINWYASILNSVYDCPVYIQGEAHSNEANIRYDCSYSDRNKGMMGFTVKRNDFDAYFIWLNFIGYPALCDFIIENNIIAGAEYGIYCQTKPTDSNMDGVYIRNNDISCINEEYSPELLNRGNNKYGWKVCIVIDENFVSNLHGDVNQDGKISLKDSTLIRYYYMGLSELSAAQLVLADVNADDKVNLKDATRIRQHLLDPSIPLENVKDDIYYPGDY